MSHHPEHWRLRGIRLKLLGSRCVQCECPVFPPRPYCPICTVLASRDPAAHVWDTADQAIAREAVDSAIEELRFSS